jgi:hypothetical protein
VHGFQGNAFDMRLFKNNLSVVYPDALFLSSSSNEDCTDGDISVMGKNLATEVQAYLAEWCPGTLLGRISFIGHSLGGVIIRAALPLLSEYKEKMYTFFTLSSPHLGYMHNNNKIINAGLKTSISRILISKFPIKLGLWVLKRWKKSIALKQLSMTDEKTIEETFLYKLSQMPGLNWFHNIGLVSSYQDQYVPFESARMEKISNKTNESL